MVHTASGWGEPDDPDAHHLWRPADATELLIVLIRCTERQHAQYPLLRQAGRGADCRTGVVMICRLQEALRGAAEALYQPSQPYPSTAARHGELLRVPSKPGCVPSSAGSPARTGGKVDGEDSADAAGGHNVVRLQHPVPGAGDPLVGCCWVSQAGAPSRPHCRGVTTARRARAA
jgi:hypothetical protein